MLLRTICAAVALAVVPATLHAQARQPKYPAVCAKGVRTYTDRAQLPAKRDSLTMPPSPGPVRVTNEEEAAAAELAIRERAGSIGATSILVLTQRKEEDGGVRMERSISAFFIPSDSAQAQETCRKK
jgi:hypothetical protein